MILFQPSEGDPEEIRIHDYARMYSTPGLYEAVVQERLECRSPQKVVDMLESTAADLGRPLSELRVLDIGAGNGVVGELLQEKGVEYMVGLDDIPEAEEAAGRDRPGLYRDYLTADLTALTDAETARLTEHAFNCLTCVGALGFGDIPPDAFATAYDLIADGGLVAFTISERFISTDSDDAFSGFIRRLVDGGSLGIVAQERFQHRLSIEGAPLHYVAIAGTKLGDAGNVEG